MSAATSGGAVTLQVADLERALEFYRTACAPQRLARWGAGAIGLIVMVGFLKLWFWLRMEATRVLREIERLELQIVRATER